MVINPSFRVGDRVRLSLKERKRLCNGSDIERGLLREIGKYIGIITVIRHTSEYGSIYRVQWSALGFDLGYSLDEIALVRA